MRLGRVVARIACLVPCRCVDCAEDRSPEATRWFALAHAPPGVLRISNSVITQNETGRASGGAIESMSGDSLTGDTPDGALSGTLPKL